MKVNIVEDTFTICCYIIICFYFEARVDTLLHHPKLLPTQTPQPWFYCYVSKLMFFRVFFGFIVMIYRL